MPARLLTRSPDDDGFTLVELLVVILILGILIAIAVPTFLGQQGKAQDAGVLLGLNTAYKNAAADSIAPANDGNFESASDEATSISDNEPELAPVAPAATIANVTTKGTLYIVEGDGQDASNPDDLTGGGNFEAAELSNSGNICTLKVTDHALATPSCVDPTALDSGGGGTGSGDDGSGSGDDGSGSGGTTPPPPPPPAPGALSDYEFVVSGPAPASYTVTTNCTLGGDALSGGIQNQRDGQTMSGDAANADDSGWAITDDLPPTGEIGEAICASIVGGITQEASAKLVSTGKGWTSTTGEESETATCPTDEVVVGGGYAIGNMSTTSKYGYASYPSADNSWTVSTRLISTNFENLTAYAMCAVAPPGYHIFSAVNSALNGSNNATLTESCPAGQEVLGGGYSLTGSTVPTANLHTDIIGDYPASATAWTTAYTAGTSNNTLTTYAICVDAS